MENKEEDKHNILLIGETGSGKSSLGNFILGIDDAFEVSDDPESCTTDSIRKNSKIDPDITVIDTPGLQDSQGRDREHYEQMLKIIKSMKHLHFIIVVLNFASPRFTCSIQHMIKFLCNVFPKNFRHHIGIVFTHYDEEYEFKRNKNKNISPKEIKLKKFVPEIMKLISQTTNEKLFLAPPVFFLDSTGIEGDDNSQKELNRLIFVAKSLQPIEDIREKCSIKYKEQKEEFETRQDQKVEGDKIITYIKKFRRTKFIDYNNNVSYSDWEQFSCDKIEKDITYIKKGNEKENQISLAESISNFLDFYAHCASGYNYYKGKKEYVERSGRTYDSTGVSDFFKGWLMYDDYLSKKK